MSWLIFYSALVFVGMLLTPMLIKRLQVKKDRNSTAVLSQSDALKRHGFYLQEISHAAGIDFIHQAPVLDARLSGIMPEVASMGASVSVVDFDRDGWPDIYVTDSAYGTKIGCTEICITEHFVTSPPR